MKINLKLLTMCLIIPLIAIQARTPSVGDSSTPFNPPCFPYPMCVIEELDETYFCSNYEHKCSPNLSDFSTLTDLLVCRKTSTTKVCQPYVGIPEKPCDLHPNSPECLENKYR